MSVPSVQSGTAEAKGSDAHYALQLIHTARQFQTTDPELFGKLVEAAMEKHGRPALDAAGLLPMEDA